MVAIRTSESEIRFYRRLDRAKLRAPIVGGYICSTVIGNGNNSSFWYDKWLGGDCFKVRFSRLFNLDLLKDAPVAQKFQNSDFAVSFRRLPRGGIEESQFQELSSLLSSVVLSSFSDRWPFTLNGHDDFSVKSDREEIDMHFLVTSSSSMRWSKFLSIKLNVCAWRMFLDKLPTMIFFNRGLDVPCVLYPNCENVVESQNRLFFGCSMALDLFRLLDRWWNIDIINLIGLFY
ncbi:hypothetical protein Tco_1236706 [Tanacetum coccineum]